jgi:multidrug efflux pump subunit AcrB
MQIQEQHGHGLLLAFVEYRQEIGAAQDIRAAISLSVRLIQFNNAIKPLLIFAAAPYGAIGALIALAIMGTPFGFMAFLGVASLIGVIVSHVIVLFDFIEEMHEKGEPLERALPDAGIERIRPVMKQFRCLHL